MAVYRIEVRAIHAGDDPSGAGVLNEIRQMGVNEVADVRCARVFLLEGEEGVLTGGALERIAREVLIDPVTETYAIGGNQESRSKNQEGGHVVEVHLKAGVMDPVAASCEMAISDLLRNQESRSKNQEGVAVRVRTGKRFELLGHVSSDLMGLIAKRLLVNESIEVGHFGEFLPTEFPEGTCV